MLFLVTYMYRHSAIRNLKKIRNFYHHSPSAGRYELVSEKNREEQKTPNNGWPQPEQLNSGIQLNIKEISTGPILLCTRSTTFVVQRGKRRLILSPMMHHTFSIGLHAGGGAWRCKKVSIIRKTLNISPSSRQILGY